jgi:hypothetical protein
VTDAEIVDGFQSIRDFTEFCFKRLEEMLNDRVGSLDHNLMTKIGDIESRLSAVEKNVESQ